MSTVALALTFLALLALLGHLILGDRPSPLRLLVLQMASAAVERNRPIADLIQRAAPDHRRRDRLVLEHIGDELDGGASLGDALRVAAPHHFPPAMCHTLRAAEGSPSLAATLAGMKHIVSASLTAGTRLHLALFYPAILALGFLACGSMLFTASPIGRPTWNPALVGPALWAVLAVIACYLGCARILGTTQVGQRAFGRARHVLGGILDRAFPNRARTRRAAFFASLAHHVEQQRPLHTALRDSAHACRGRDRQRIDAAATAAASGADALAIWRCLELSQAAAVRLASAGQQHTERLATALHDLAHTELQHVHRANERALRWIPLTAIVVFGALIGWEFAHLMQWTGAIQQEILGW